MCLQKWWVYFDKENYLCMALLKRMCSCLFRKECVSGSFAENAQAVLFCIGLPAISKKNIAVNSLGLFWTETLKKSTPYRIDLLDDGRLFSALSLREISLERGLLFSAKREGFCLVLFLQEKVL